MDEKNIFTSISEGASKCVDYVADKFTHEHVIKNAASLLEDSASELLNNYEAQGYLVQALKFYEDDEEGVLIQITNSSSTIGNFLKSATGLQLAVCVKFIPVNERDLKITICQGKWLDKVMVNVVSWFVLQPLFATSIIGLWKQKSLIDRIEREILCYFANHSAVGDGWICDF